MDCSLSGSSVHGIFQARVLEWIAISFSRGSSWPRNWTQVSRIAGRHFTIWATREAHNRKAYAPLILHLLLVELSYRGLNTKTEKAMAPHSSTLAWKIPRMEEPVGCSPWARKESDMTERLHFHFSLSCIGEGNGNPLQCSCLENPRGSLVGCCLWGRTELDTTEAT